MGVTVNFWQVENVVLSALTVSHHETSRRANNVLMQQCI